MKFVWRNRASENINWWDMEILKNNKQFKRDTVRASGTRDETWNGNRTHVPPRASRLQCNLLLSFEGPDRLERGAAARLRFCQMVELGLWAPHLSPVWPEN